MIRVAICDDEAYMSDRIRTMAVDFFHGKNMEVEIRRFSCGEELSGGRSRPSGPARAGVHIARYPGRARASRDPSGDP